MKRKIGAEYEEKAAEYLQKKGYRILNRNVVYRCGEIDLVAEISSTLVFVEVRMRDPLGLIAPEETVGFAKQVRLLRAVQLYLMKYKGRARDVRIDLLAYSGEHPVHVPDFLSMR